jgi:hypothetical protein
MFKFNRLDSEDKKLIEDLLIKEIIRLDSLMILRDKYYCNYTNFKDAAIKALKKI